MNRIVRLIFVVLSFAFTASTCCAGNLGHALGTDQTLRQGDYLTSQNGKYILAMQTDGSLVLYRQSDGKVIYRMAKYGQFAAMQTDGNFVEYNSSGNWIWATHTDVSTGEKRIALLQDNGSLIISCQMPLIVTYWSSGADTDYDPGQGTGRYPPVVSNLGAAPGVPSIGNPSEAYFFPPGQVVGN
jgi:hypothetical protein